MYIFVGHLTVWNFQGFSHSLILLARLPVIFGQKALTMWKNENIHIVF